ncbi:MAG TPA: hypothetical protein VGL71_06410 [Urbifossiella sp.]|jgi:hypothetical protein
MAKKKPHRKADAATIQGRIDEVLRIRIDGAAFHDVQQYSAEKGWGGKPGEGLSERQIREYMGRADKMLADRQEQRRRLIIGQHLARRDSLYARAVNAADHRTALAVLDSTAKLQGLFTDERQLRELAKLAASQGEQIRELQRRLDATCQPDSATPSPPEPPPGATAGDDEPEREA